MEWSELLSYLVNFFGFVAIYLANKNGGKSTMPIEPFLWLVLIISIFETITTFIQVHFPNLQYATGYVFMVYGLFEFLTIWYYFKHILNLKYWLLLKVFLVAFLLLYTYFLVIWDIENCLKTDSYLILLQTFFIITSTFLWLRDTFEDAQKNALFNDPDFYFVFGFMFYFSASIVLYLLADYLSKKGYDAFWDYYIYNIVFCGIWRFLLIIGVWKAKAKLD